MGDKILKILKSGSKRIFDYFVSVAKKLYKAMARKYKANPFVYNLAIEIVVLIGLICFYILHAFKTLSYIAIPIVVFPACFVFYGMMFYLISHSTPEGKEKHRIRYLKFKKWFNKSREDNEMITLSLIFGVDILLFLGMVALLF